MNNADIEEALTAKGIRPTANRILVYRHLLGAHRPVAMSEIEAALAPMDKGSIFRVLERFAQHDVVHEIEDGSRSLKYELCTAEGSHDISDQHAHFYCKRCGNVYCLDSITVPQVTLPEGYHAHSANLMFKGICPDCQAD